MRARTLAAVAAAITLVSSTAQAGGFTPVPILAGPEDQTDPQGNGTFLLWSQNSQARPNRYNVYASMDGGDTRFRVNRPGTQTGTGDVNQEGSEAIYQEIDRGRSDLQMIDLVTSDRSDLPAGVNTRAVEWAPRLSDGYILFERDTPRTDRRLLILYDRVAQTKTILADVNRNRVWLYPYEVGSQYASWERFDGRRWTAWIRDIEAGTDTRIPTVNRRAQYGPVVDEVNGYAYWVRSAGGCGNNVRILKAPLTSLDAPTVIATMPDRVDVWTMSLEQDAANARLDLLFTRRRCGPSQGDLFEVQGVDDLMP
jgi:hypothetical protein